MPFMVSRSLLWTSGVQDGYPESCSTLAPARTAVALILARRASRAERIELRVLIWIDAFLGAQRTMASLVEVSTRPGISMLMAATPCGRPRSRDRKRFL